MSDHCDYDHQRDTQLEDAYDHFVISDAAGVVVAVYSLGQDLWRHPARESLRTLAEDDFAGRRAKGEVVRWDYIYSRTRIRVGMSVAGMRQCDRRASAAELECKVDTVLAEMDRLRGLTMCTTCGGSPHPSGLVCVCGGTGLAVDEAVGLRRELVALQLDKQNGPR